MDNPPIRAVEVPPTVSPAIPTTARGGRKRGRDAASGSVPWRPPPATVPISVQALKELQRHSSELQDGVRTIRIGSYLEPLKQLGNISIVFTTDGTHIPHISVNIWNPGSPHPQLISYDQALGLLQMKKMEKAMLAKPSEPKSKIPPPARKSDDSKAKERLNLKPSAVLNQDLEFIGKLTNKDWLSFKNLNLGTLKTLSTAIKPTMVTIRAFAASALAEGYILPSEKLDEFLILEPSANTELFRVPIIFLKKTAVQSFRDDFQKESNTLKMYGSKKANPGPSA